MKNIVFRGLSLGLVMLIAGCGGGGGGSASGTTGVRVLHGSIESTPLDLIVDGQLVFNGVRYGEAEGYSGLGSGQHLLQLSETKGAAGSLLSQSINNEGGQKFTLLFYGNRDSRGLSTNLISEAVPEPAAGTGAVRVIAGAIGASSVKLTVGTGEVVAPFGSASDYVDVTPGSVDYAVRRLSDNAVFSRGTITVNEGQAYSIFVGGELGYFVTTKLLEE